MCCCKRSHFSAASLLSLGAGLAVTPPEGGGDCPPVGFAICGSAGAFGASGAGLPVCGESGNAAGFGGSGSRALTVVTFGDEFVTAADALSFEELELPRFLAWPGGSPPFFW